MNPITFGKLWLPLSLGAATILTASTCAAAHATSQAATHRSANHWPSYIVAAVKDSSKTRYVRDASSYDGHQSFTDTWSVRSGQYFETSVEDGKTVPNATVYHGVSYETQPGGSTSVGYCWVSSGAEKVPSTPSVLYDDILGDAAAGNTDVLTFTHPNARLIRWKLDGFPKNTGYISLNPNGSIGRIIGEYDGKTVARGWATHGDRITYPKRESFPDPLKNLCTLGG